MHVYTHRTLSLLRIRPALREMESLALLLIGSGMRCLRSVVYFNLAMTETAFAALNMMISRFGLSFVLIAVGTIGLLLSGDRKGEAGDRFRAVASPYRSGRRRGGTDAHPPPPPPPRTASARGALRDDDKPKDGDECVVCKVKKRQYAFKECGHIGLCFSCWDMMSAVRGSFRCPICRAVIRQNPLRVFT